MPLARRSPRRLPLTIRSEYEPGQRVRHPTEPGWGTGQIQSVIGDRVTVNFENAGKVLINVTAVPLTILDEDG